MGSLFGRMDSLTYSFPSLNGTDQEERTAEVGWTTAGVFRHVRAATSDVHSGREQCTRRRRVGLRSTTRSGTEKSRISTTRGSAIQQKSEVPPTAPLPAGARGGEASQVLPPERWPRRASLGPRQARQAASAGSPLHRLSAMRARALAERGLGFRLAYSTCRLFQRKKNTGCGSRRETIEDISSLAAFRQDSRSAQDHQVLRDVGLTPAEQRLQVADTGLAVTQRAGDLQPDGVGERLEHAGLGGTFRIRFHIQFLEYDDTPCSEEQGEMSYGRRTVRRVGRAGGSRRCSCFRQPAKSPLLVDQLHPAGRPRPAEGPWQQARPGGEAVGGIALAPVRGRLADGIPPRGLLVLLGRLWYQLVLGMPPRRDPPGESQPTDSLFLPCPTRRGEFATRVGRASRPGGLTCWNDRPHACGVSIASIPSTSGRLSA